MRPSKRPVSLLALLFLSAGMAAQTPATSHMLLPHEPAPNLGKLKLRLIAYHDCKGDGGCYATDLDRQINLAIAFVDRRAAKADSAKAGRKEKLALVLDIDETSLSNWEEELPDDLGYIKADFDAWVNKSKAPAIPGTLRLANDALKHGVAIFFITGRAADQRAATAANLTSVGYHDWSGLALRGPHPSSEATADYKSRERKKIVDAGYTLILNMGDQMSDLSGTPQAELSVKLPNPFYYLP